MFRFDAINLAALLFSIVLPATGCETTHPQNTSRPPAQKETGANSPKPKESNEPAGRVEATPNAKEAASGERVAAPEIEGCSREQTTFFSGEVRSFKRTKDSLEITIRTDWNTTAKLVQPEKSPEVIFRRGEQKLADEELRELESALLRDESQYRATVWVCRVGDQKIIKLIEWSEGKGASKIPGSAPRRN